VDNICHTLVGAALAEAGLKRRTALGSATLMIAANFPDIDVIAVPLGHSLGFRRGITHGILALLLLPVVLTFLMIGWHRWRGRGERPDTRWLLALSAIGIVTHPVLDWMNTYGMRWLMPLDPTWFFGDALFIVDPWIWLTLGAGVWVSRRRGTLRPAKMALFAVGAYIAAMMELAGYARGAVKTALTTQGLTPDTVVVEPLPANPFQRRVIYHWNAAYHLATFTIIDRALSAPWLAIPLNAGDPAVEPANRTPQGREYHSWTRLPYYIIETTPDTTWVTIADARYTLDGRSSWATTRIRVPRATARSAR